MRDGAILLPLFRWDHDEDSRLLQWPFGLVPVRYALPPEFQEKLAASAIGLCERVS